MRTAVPMRRALQGALVLAAAVHASRDADAYCRTSSKTPKNWDEATQGCYSGDPESKLLYWRNPCVGYSLHQDASRQVSLEKATAIVASAFAGWHDVSCANGGGPSMNAVDRGPVVCGEVRYNKSNANQNVIVFRDDVWPHADPVSTLGLTTVTYDTKTGELLGADMEINSTLPLIVQATQQGRSDDSNAAGTAETRVGYDLATIIAHETGHFLGLAHSALATAMMAAHYSDGVRITDDDIAGICAAYPSDGTRPTSGGVLHAAACDSTPPHGFSSECAAPSTDPPASSDDSDGGCGVSRLPPSNSAGIVASWAAMLGLCILRLTRRRR